jgi:hypothetical protein
MKKMIYIALCTMIVWGCDSPSTSEPEDSPGIGGTTGPLTWSFAGRTLTIKGAGAMPDYPGIPPWFANLGGITTVNIQKGVTSIGDYAFYGLTNLTSLTIPNSVTTIGEYAFQGCTGLTSITIPNSVTTIGKAAFFGCLSLSLTIPNSVTSIGLIAFEGCANVTFQSSNSATLTVPQGSKPAYQAATYRNEFGTIIEINSEYEIMHFSYKEVFGRISGKVYGQMDKEVVLC